MLGPDHVAEIEQILGAPLGADALAEVETADQLSPVAIDVVRKVAKRSHQLAFKYLREVVRGEGVGPLMVFLERVIEGK
jgi:hypothetical protein